MNHFEISIYIKASALETHAGQILTKKKENLTEIFFEISRERENGMGTKKKRILQKIFDREWDDG